MYTGGNGIIGSFNSLADRGFYDCHWAVNGKEVQSFWGPEACEAYQDDHVFIDTDHASSVVNCEVIDNRIVRELSDHGPMLLVMK